MQVGTILTVNPGTSDYSDATTVSATLIDTYTSAGAANEPVTLTLNGTESCTGTTNASGVVSCSITPGEPAGTYALTASFAGDATPWPHLEASTGSNSFVVTHEETALSYTGVTSATNGSPATLSGVLTTDSGTVAVVGRTVTFTLGSGTSAQKCSGTTNASGAVSCVIAKVNQTTSPVAVAASFAGDTYYAPSNASGSVTISTPTTLSVSAGNGHLRAAHHPDGHADQLRDRRSDQWADGHPDAQQHTVVHRDDQRERARVVQRDPERACCDVHRLRVVLRRHQRDAASA